MDIVTYAMAVNCIKRSLDGLGVLKGAACTIKSITEVEGGNEVTFEWTGNSGTKQTRTMFVKDGEDGAVVAVDIIESGNMNAITSNAVAHAIADINSTIGDINSVLEAVL